ncbi:hypothetical protein ACWFZ6_19150 [Methylorubrum extorquens]
MAELVPEPGLEVAARAGGGQLGAEPGDGCQQRFDGSHRPRELVLERASALDRLADILRRALEARVQGRVVQDDIDIHLAVIAAASH